MKKFNRVLAFLLALVVIFTMLPATGLAVVEQQPSTEGATIISSPLDDPNYGNVISQHYPQKADDTGMSGTSSSLTQGSVAGQQIADLNVDLTQNSSKLENLAISAYEPTERVRVIVVLEDESLLEKGFSSQQIASNDASVRREINTMKAEQNDVMDKIHRIVSNLNASNVQNFGIAPTMSAPELKYNYNVAVNGMAVDVPYAALEEICKLDNVKSAFIAPMYDLPEDMSDRTADPSMYATGTSFGTVLTWDTLGYTGSGMRIAIIDTGLDTDHPSFSADGFETTETSLTEAEIDSVLENLNAYDLFPGLTAESLYISTKIPFGFNYVDENLDVTHDNDYMGDHGTHVAGIAAANKLDTTTVVGVAPDAQLIAMKVFGTNGGAYFDDILAALEDCFYLNVDAVNLSLGSPAGFSTSGDAETDAIFQRIMESDIIASISAGNSSSAAYGNGLGTNVNFASDPDNGIISSPATYPGATVVASLENSNYMTNYIVAAGRNIVYADMYAVPGYYDQSIVACAGEQTYVVIPGVGTAEDFGDLDLTGKIALVQRGEIDFVTKQTNAYEHGAIACLVYDNVEGDLGYMQHSGLLPNAMITLADGLYLVELAGEDGEGTLTIMPADELIAAESPLAGQLSDFSSWGVTPDLQLVPDVTAPGGNIYSCYMDGQYGTMSGTSMSAPHIAGMSALVLQYLRDEYNLSEAKTHTVAEALIMSTAVPVTEPSGALYSPRKQGSGSANVYNAITSAGYLTVDGGKPKVSLGDDPEKTGVYTFSFEINNLTNEDMSYRLDGTALTDQVQQKYGYLFMGETSRTLDAEVTFSVLRTTYMQMLDYNKDGHANTADVQDFLDDVNYERDISDKMAFDLVTDGVLDTADVQALYELIQNQLRDNKFVETVFVPANGSVIVTATVTLSAADKAYMDACYENGIYVDGFVRCYAVNGTTELSLPFMGFYGEWSDAGEIFDDGWYYDDYAMPERYFNVLWTTFAGERSGFVLGENPYMDEEYDPAHNVISPNGDGYQDAIDDIYLGMMRNARTLSISWQIDGEPLAQAIAEYVRKSYYLDAAGICYPFVYSTYFMNYYTFMDKNGDPLPDGTVVDLVIEGYLDDGDYEVDEVIDDISMVVDNTKPVLHLDSLEYITDPDTGDRTLSFQVSDNYAIAAVVPMTRAGSPIEYIPVEDGAGEKYTVTLDVSSYDSTFVIAVCDYGCNESYYEITFEGEFNVDFDKFYAYRRYAAVPMYSEDYGGYVYYLTDYYNGWHSFTTPDSLLMHTSMYTDNETAVAAAEYIDGYIFGVDVNGEIFVMKSGDWSRIPLGTMPMGRDASYEYVPYPALDMAYDYANDVLYILTDELVAGDGGHLMTLNYMTGAVTDLGIVTTSDGSQPLTLACDNSGVLYTIDIATGDLYTIDPENKEVIKAEYWWQDDVIYIRGERVGATGYVPAHVQSMTVDHETDTLYWLAFSGVSAGQSVMCKVDKSTGALTAVSAVEYNSEMTALYKPYNSGEDIIPDAELEDIELNKTKITMSVNSMDQLVAYPVPFNADLGELTWTSSNSSVAMVVDGTVVALGEGNATITVTSSAGVSAQCNVDVIDLSTDLTLYDMGNDGYWQTFNAAYPTDVEYLEGPPTYYGFTAAAYFNGYVYACENGGAFYRLDPATLEGTQIGSSNSTLFGMAFNYADGYMYGIEQYQINMWESYNYVVRINLNTGALERVCELPSDYTPLGHLAIDYDGNFYSICGDNWTYDMVLVKWNISDEGVNILDSWSLGEAGYNISNYTSMVYSAKDNGIFFSDGVGTLYWIDMDSLSTDTARVINVGYIGEFVGYAMNLCMFTVPAEEPELPETEITSVTVPGSYMLLVGGSVSAGVTAEPWNAYPTVSYSIADESIATVNADGTITGVSAGKTTLTVTVEGWDKVYQIPVTVAEPTGTLYGFLLPDNVYEGNFFVSFTDTDPVNEIAAVSDYTDFTVFSGAYYDGVIYGYGQDNQGNYNYKNYFLTIDAETHEITMGAKVHYTLRDMAMDYTSDNLYAIAEGAEYIGAVAQVNRETGEVTIIADTGIPFAAMTIAANGQMYGIGEDDNLYAIDKATGKLTLIGSTGVNAGRMFQSMHYDLDTGNVYWAQMADDQTSSLRIVDVTTGSTTSLGTISPTGAMIGALYTVPGNEPTEPNEDTFKVTGIKLPETSTVVKGNTVQLKATVLTSMELQPAGTASTTATSAADVVVTWTSSDESIATVDQTGLVTGVAAGEVTITASAEGYSDTCKVVVTEGERLLYAYDETNTQWISFSSSAPGTVTTVRDDAEGESKLAAATYTGEVIYAYDENGNFYSINTDTFERTALGDGINGMTYEVDTTDWWGDTYTVECALRIVDLSYDNGTLYAAFNAVDPDYGDAVATLFCTVDVASGSVTTIFASTEVFPTNLLVDNGIAYFVDGFMTGILTYVDLTAEEFNYSQAALVQGYWGDAETSVGLFKDELTGTVYAIRDFTASDGEYSDDYSEFYPWDGVSGDATLCTLNLADADIVELGTIGTGLQIIGLFIM